MSDLDLLLANSGTRLLAAARSAAGAAWHLKPAPDQWSPAQVFEHVIKVERAVGGALASAAPADAVPEGAFTDSAEKIRGFLMDRTVHPPAPTQMLPSEMPATFAELAPQFEAAHAALRALHGTVGAALAQRYVKHGRFGQVDGLRWMELLAAHADRHALQIDEARTAGASQ